MSPDMTPLISACEISDYGNPTIDEEFFKRNPFRDFSAQRLLYSCLLQPQVESFARHFARQFIHRGEYEDKQIRETKDVIDLIAILKQEPDPLNHRLLMDKLLEKREVAAPLLIEELRHDQNHCFVELSARILFESKIKCVAPLLRLIESTSLDAYTLSVLCLLLGMTGGLEVLKPLWDRFHFFKEKFPQENFSQGPLTGLWEVHA